MEFAVSKTRRTVGSQLFPLWRSQPSAIKASYKERDLVLEYLKGFQKAKLSLKL